MDYKIDAINPNQVLSRRFAERTRNLNLSYRFDHKGGVGCCLVFYSARGRKGKSLERGRTVSDLAFKEFSNYSVDRIAKQVVQDCIGENSRNDYFPLENGGTAHMRRETSRVNEPGWNEHRNCRNATKKIVSTGLCFEKEN